jgi:hypothetical protein
MNIKEEIINFCNTNEFNIIDNSKFEYLKNEIVFAKGGKIISSALLIRAYIGTYFVSLLYDSKRW